MSACNRIPFFAALLLVFSLTPSYASFVSDPSNFSNPNSTFDFNDIGLPLLSFPYQVLYSPTDFGDFVVRNQRSSQADGEMLYKTGDACVSGGCIAERSESDVFWTFLFDQPINSFGVTVDKSNLRDSDFMNVYSVGSLNYFTTETPLGVSPTPEWTRLGNNKVFVGWESTESFRQLSFRLAGTGGAAFDDVVYGVSPIPIPAAAWLFASALGLIGWIARSKNARTKRALAA